jgi:hypothetical protein
MSETVRIESEEAFSGFLDVVDGFRDALLHEIVVLHPGYVKADGKMVGDAQLPNARLIFQSQFEDIVAVQLDLKRISSFAINFVRDFRWKAEFKPGQVRLYLVGYNGSQCCEVCAAEMEYKLLGKEARGPRYRMVRDELLVDDLFYNEL